ncbi:hypothetical protein BSKO_10114 [Bryopsis sp. KO-2023]|nr:hypothetical protein BSKO_10114 [Bryopsis sp. KO-2023]
MGRANEKKAHKPSGKLGKRARKRQEADGKAKRVPVKSVKSNDKLKRRQASELRREKARAAELELRRRPGPPTVVGLLPLSKTVNCAELFSSLVASCIKDGSMMEDAVSRGQQMCTVQLPGVRKMKWTMLPLLKDYTDILAVVDFLCAAELIILVADGREDHPVVDEVGVDALQLLRALGLPSVVGAVQNIGSGGLKESSAAKKRVAEVINDELCSGVKVFPVGGRSDCESLLHHLQPQKPTIPVWRRQRSSLLVHRADLRDGCLEIEGFVRHQRLSANQVMSIAGVGDCRIHSISSAVPPVPLGAEDSRQKEDSAMECVLDKADPEKLHPMVKENEVEDPEEEEESVSMPDAVPMVKKRVPKGTSEYQAAWIVDDENYLNTDSEMEALDEELNEMHLQELDDVDMDSRSVGVATTMVDSEADSDDIGWNDGLEQMALDEIKAAEEEEREYPDEFELPTDVEARNRLLNYRGLKSFRTSPWDPREGLPRDYGKVFAFENFRNACKRFRAEKEGVEKGRYVSVLLEVVNEETIKSVSKRVMEGIGGQAPPFMVYGLMRHETKMSVVNFRIRKAQTYEDPVANKEEFLFHTGFRSYAARPLLSTDTPRCDKHKMEKFLPPGGHSIATVYAPAAFPPVPLLGFKIGLDGKPELAFSGSLQSCDPDRIVLKKIILTGRAAAVKKKTCVVVGMFHDPEDVRWFKPLELWTKYGRSGYIKESLGTHGAFKSYFNGVVQQRDTICVSLYKRVFPVWPNQMDDAEIDEM